MHVTYIHTNKQQCFVSNSYNSVLSTSKIKYVRMGKPEVLNLYFVRFITKEERDIFWRGSLLGLSSVQLCLA